MERPPGGASAAWPAGVAFARRGGVGKPAGAIHAEPWRTPALARTRSRWACALRLHLRLRQRPPVSCRRAPGSTAAPLAPIAVSRQRTSALCALGANLLLLMASNGKRDSIGKIADFEALLYSTKHILFKSNTLVLINCNFSKPNRNILSIHLVKISR